METGPTPSPYRNSILAGITRTPLTLTASRRISPSINPSIPSSVPRKWPPTSWCRNTAVISTCPLVVYGEAVSTGPNHSGVELHGFLSYLIHCNLEGREYRVFGYKGKQVRDNIHSVDVAQFMFAFVENPRCGEVYNLGGGKENSCSILEAFKITEKFTGQAQRYTYVDENRIGDHICYYSDLRKMKTHYPKWDITKTLDQTISEIVEARKMSLNS